MNQHTLGKYQILEQLGEGGFGVVYKAQNPVGLTVALKVLKPQWSGDGEAIARFRQEALSAGTLFHQRIATITDMDEAGGRLFLVMRYVDGCTLEEVLEERGRLPWEEALQISRQAAEGLAYAHKQGLIHRDIKPGNILLGEEGVVLTDFGLVKAIAASGISSKQVIVGTPNYIAPEIWRNKGTTPKADVYSLACVVYEMVTGQKLFEGDSAAAVMTMHVLDGPQLPEVWPDGCPAGLGAVLAQGLAADPQKRLDLAQFVDALAGEAERKAGKEPVQGRLSVKTMPSDEMVFQLAEGVEMVFVRVPAGEFWMGSDENDKDVGKDEEPRHKVYLDACWMGKYPVTNAQYAAFVEASGFQTTAEEAGYSWEWDFQKKKWVKTNGLFWKKPRSNQDIARKMEHPVVHVSWKDAQAFCLWASKVSGRAIHLPSEAQWEKAARGTDGRTYPWGEEAPNPRLLNFKLNVGDTTAVGSYPAGACPYGALDMAGNVWEWVADWYGEDYYSKSPGKNPAGPSSGDYRILRGGSWFNIEGVVRSAARNRVNPDLTNVSRRGFRCASSEAAP